MRWVRIVWIISVGRIGGLGEVVEAAMVGGG